MTATHGRLPWPAPGQLDPAQRALYDSIVGGPRADQAPSFELKDPEGRLHGPFNAMLVSPEVGSAVEQLGSAVRFSTHLSPREREIAILVVAAVQQSGFERYAHEAVGRDAGLTDSELKGLRESYDKVGTFSPRESLIQRVAHSIAVTGDLCEELFSTARADLGLVVLQDLLTLIGYYQMLALFLRVWRTPLP